MATTDFQIDHVALDKAKGTMQTDVIEAIRGTAKALLASVDAVAKRNNGWNGAAAHAFHDMQLDLNKDITQLNQRLDTLAQTLGTASTKTHAQEDASRASF